MRLPHLNRQLVLEAAQQVEDGAGGFYETWSALGTHWAEVKARTGRERERETAATARVEYRITVRAAPQGAVSRPKPGQRFRDGPRYFRILAVADRSTDGRFLTCFATEEVAS